MAYLIAIIKSVKVNVKNMHISIANMLQIVTDNKTMLLQ